MTKKDPGTPSQNWLVCPGCGYGNPVPNKYCQLCWAKLDKTTPISSETAAEMAEESRLTRRRKRLTRLIVRASVLLLAIAGLLLYMNWDIFRPLPSTSISATPGPDEWAMWRHDPGHSGFNPHDGARPRGILKWRFTTDEPIFSSPAVVDGTLYLGSGDRRLVALDADSGQLKWEWPGTGPFESSPAVADGSLYIGLLDRRLVALDTTDGSLKWQQKLGSPIFASPVVADGVVYVTAIADRLYAIDAASGQIRWVADTKNPMSNSSPAVSQGMVVVGSRIRGEPHLTGVWGGSVFFIDAFSGRIQMKYHTLSRIDSSPTISDGVVYIGSRDQRVYALDPTARNWPLEWPTLKMWSYAYLLGYAPYPPDPSGLFWHFRADGEVRTSPAVAGGMVYFGTTSGTFYALDTAGQEQWRFDGSAPILSSAAVGNGVVYFGDSQGKLYAMDARNGERLWEFTTGGKISGSPTLANGMVYLTSEDGTLYAFE